MIILLHVVLALSSLACTAFTCFSPSRTKLKVSGSLVILTLASGTYLVISLHSPMVQACMSGLTFTSVSLVGLIAAKIRLNSVS